jgi:hypothetical protein
MFEELFLWNGSLYSAPDIVLGFTVMGFTSTCVKNIIFISFFIEESKFLPILKKLPTQIKIRFTIDKSEKIIYSKSEKKYTGYSL